MLDPADRPSTPRARLGGRHDHDPALWQPARSPWVEEFIELVCSDPELVAAEFAAIIAAERPTLPPACPLCAARSAHARPQDTDDGARTSVAGRASGRRVPEPASGLDSARRLVGWARFQHRTETPPSSFDFQGGDRAARQLEHGSVRWLRAHSSRTFVVPMVTSGPQASGSTPGAPGQRSMHRSRLAGPRRGPGQSFRHRDISTTRPPHPWPRRPHHPRAGGS